MCENKLVYSTNTELLQESSIKGIKQIMNKDQKLEIYKETKNRSGKVVIIIKGFIGKKDDLKNLEKYLKRKCGSGGTVKNGEIIIQGDIKEKVISILEKEGYYIKNR